MIPKIQVSGHNGRRQTFLLLRLSEQLRLVGVGQEAALHQHPRTRDVLHEVHRVPYGLGSLFVSGVYCQIQRLLDGLRQPGGRLL